MIADAIVAEARGWLGTRFHHGQAAKGVGCDCIGLVAGVAKECGVPEADAWFNDPRFKGYGRTPNPETLIAGCDAYLDRIPIESAGAGDVLVMNHEPETQPRHFAIVTRINPMYMIHAYAQAKKVAENRVDEVWRRRVLRAYRFR